MIRNKRKRDKAIGFAKDTGVVKDSSSAEEAAEEGIGSSGSSGSPDKHEESGNDRGSIFRALQYIGMRFVIGTGLVLKHIMLLPVRLLLLIINKLGDLFRFSLTFKISLIYTMLVLLALVIFNFSLFNGFKYFMNFSETTAFKAVISKMSQTLNAEEKIDYDQINQLANRDNLIIHVRDEKGKYIYSTHSGIKPTRLLSETREPIVQVQIFNEHYLMTSVFVKYPDKQYELQVMKDISSIYDYLNSLSMIGVGLTALMVIVIVAIGSRISKNLLSPITTMTEQVKAISIKNLDRRLDVSDAKDELKDLAMQFNSMLDHIEDAYQKQNQFVSDASHELRTPISVINGYSSMLDRWGKRDPAILEEAISAIKSETHQMQSLIEKLLFLARSDRNKIEMEIERVKLHELVEELYKETKMIATEHQVVMDCIGESTVQGNNKLIKQMLRIFMENAIKFTEPNGTITIMMRQVAGRTMIAVKDSGTGIPKEDVDKVFDRFYRSDKSRTKKSGGSGLGLSIAKWIIDQHGAEVKLYSELGMGTKVEVWFNPKVKLVDEEDIKGLEHFE